VAGPDLSRIHPLLKKIARNLPKVAAANGIQIRISSGYRSRAVQAKLYNDWISGRAQYPANPPGQSQHEKGRALDILSTDTNALVGLLTGVGLLWAGPEDPIHFELPPKIATGSRQSQKLSPAPTPTKAKKKSLGKKILGAASWVPGPVGIGATILDFIF
jgi:hypothetical protein